MRVVLASNNQHKLREIRAMMPAEIELINQGTLGIDPAEETGLTFVENALLKARHASRQSGLPAIADDSGLEVEALDGRPGIYSSRYAGPDATDGDNNRKLLTEMDLIDCRSARYQCVIVYLGHALDPAPIIAHGTWTGEIVREPQGQSGFGYDPLFLIPEIGKTAAQLTSDQKNQLSHRAKALSRFVAPFNA